ncbi:40S ribosomal protein S27 [Verticillium dahliae VDG1]|nr:40S ribosomal protein S27 [Verticillium dahliae VDG1]
MATIDPNQSNGGLVPALPSPVASPSVDAGAAIPTGAGQQTEATGPAFAFFTPSFDLALAAAVISMALVVIHLGLTLRKRTMFFGPVMTMASLPIHRVFAPLDALTPKTRITTAVASTAVTFTYTRLVWWITPYEHRNISKLWLPPRVTSLILVGLASIGDIISTLGNGQIIKPPPAHLQATGSVLKMLVWTAFFGLVARFTVISRRWSMDEATRKGSLELGLALTASSFFLAIIGIMNVLEKDALETLMSTRRPGSIITTEEWPSWVFNFLPTLLVLSIMAVYHPGYYLPKRLTGGRLKGKELESMEMIRDEESIDVASVKNGWVISSPKVMTEKEIEIGVSMQTYERAGGVPVAYAR